MSSSMSRVKKQMTMILQMSKGSRMIGDLQGDQSDKQCNYVSVFIVQRKVKK
jgi:hypothetical protein